VIALAVAALSPCACALEPENVLLVYNSANTDSAAVASAYLSARPGVLSLDLNDAALNVGSVSRSDYVARIRDPIRRFINGVDINGSPQGPDLSGQIVAIATTRGLPGRVLSPSGTGDEFQLGSAWASVESELTLLQQDLEAAGSGLLTHRFKGFIDNPYHTKLNTTAVRYSRAGVKQPRTFTAVPITGAPLQSVWRIDGLTPGDMYLVCRLDSAASAGPVSGTANTLALIQRSVALSVDRCGVRALLDEWLTPGPPSGFELDEDSVPPLIDGPPDFENTTSFLLAFGVTTTHDETFDFITGPELPLPAMPLLALGSYGENHSAMGWGENPPEIGDYVQTYSFGPASFFIAYESWGGTSIYAPGTQRGGQQQALDFIAKGGSFTIATVMEPFAFAIADMQFLLPNMLVHGLTFAEAAYTSIPVLSWQSTPIGDPLARISTYGGNSPTDVNGDGRLDAEDLYADTLSPGDHDCDGSVTSADAGVLERVTRAAEAFDMIPFRQP
jgi:hypothetical protein